MSIITNQFLKLNYVIPDFSLEIHRTNVNHCRRFRKI